jgi:hypothetical protein
VVIFDINGIALGYIEIELHAKVKKKLVITALLKLIIVFVELIQFFLVTSS